MERMICLFLIIAIVQCQNQPPPGRRAGPPGAPGRNRMAPLMINRPPPPPQGRAMMPPQPPPRRRPMAPPRRRPMPPAPPAQRMWRPPPPPPPPPQAYQYAPPPNCTWNPVCGSDGVSYSSPCHMPRYVWQVCSGYCPCPRAPPMPKPCVCGPVFAPVCGRDGHTYDNYCQLNCAKQAEQCSGPCPCRTPTTKAPVPKTPPPCTCENQPYNPVCGVNSKVYDNDCERNCAGVELACAGTCPCARDGEGQVEIEYVQQPKPATPKPAALPPPTPVPTFFPFFSFFQPFVPAPAPKPDNGPCNHCWMDYDPVCGGDGQTYMNYCHARCSDAEVKCTSECPCGH